MVPNLLINQVVCEIVIHCPTTLTNKKMRHEAGVEYIQHCTWTGTIGNAEYHQNNECQYTTITCSNIGCNATYERQFQEDHIACCLYRVVTCTHCRKGFRSYESDDHERDCEFQILFCPNRCRNETGNLTSLRLSELVHHRSICSRELMKCPFQDIGCDVQLPRNQMESHSSNVSIHSRGLLTTISRLIANEEILREEVRVLRHQLNDIEGRDPLRAEIADILMPVSFGVLKNVINIVRSGVTKIRGINFQLQIQLRTYDETSASLSLRLVEEEVMIRSDTVYEVELSIVVLTRNGSIDDVLVEVCTHLFCPETPIFQRFINIDNLNQPKFVINGQITLKSTVRVVRVTTNN